MLDCITTNKTDFFREKHHFDYLRDTVLPQIARRASHGLRATIWSAACPPAPSIAITLQGRAESPGDVRILASDLDTTVLATAERHLRHRARPGAPRGHEARALPPRKRARATASFACGRKLQKRSITFCPTGST